MAEIYLRDGSSVYQARIRVGGVLKRVSTRTKTAGEAQQVADALEQELVENTINSADIKLIAAAERFFAEKTKLKPRTVAEYERAMGHIVIVLGNFPLRLLTHEKLRYYVNERRKTNPSTVQIRRDLAFLSSVLSQARDWDCGVTGNVVRDYDKRNLPDAQVHNSWLKPKEVDKLIAACRRESHKAFIILAVHTGMRHQELLKLHWDEIDLDEKIIFLGRERTKNSSSREIPMSEEVLNTLLNTPPAHRKGFYFRGKEDGEAHDNMGARWRAIRKRAGLPNVRIHDMRHTFASWLKQRGVAETTIMTLMGHKTRSMVQRYSHDSRESLATAIGTVSGNTVSNTASANSRGTKSEKSVKSKGKLVIPTGFEPVTLRLGRGADEKS